MDRDNTIARLENIAKHAVHTAGEDTFILSLDDGLAIHEAIEALKAQLSQQGATSDLISRQAAIDAAKDWYEGLICGSINGLIKRLNALPTIQPQSTTGQLNDGVRSTARSTDLIDRGQAIEKFAMTAPQMSVIRIYEAVEILESMPTVQPEPRTGKWALGFDNRYMEKYYYCSRCGGRKYGEHEPLDYFCSNCGADMRGEKDE